MSVKYSLDNLLSKAKSFAKKGNIEEAVKLYQAILSDFPKNVRAQKGLEALQTHCGKGPPKEEIKNLINLYNQGHLSEVVKQAKFFTKQYPQAHILWNILGGAYLGLKDFERALKVLEIAIKLNPNYVDAYYNKGVTLQKQGKIDEAIKSYQKTISFNSNHLDALINMGIAFREQGKHEVSIDVFQKVLSIKPDDTQTYFNIGISLKRIFLKNPNPSLQKIIISLLDKKTFVRPNEVCNAALSLLKFEKQLKKHLEVYRFNDKEFEPLEIISDLSELPLLLKLMSVCPINDVGLEKLFEKLRFKLLMSIADLANYPEILKFQSVLALQCFTNEYIYNQSQEEEKKALALLEKSVKQTLSNGNQPNPQSILCLASYKPLYHFEWSSLLMVTDEIKDVFTRQITEPNKEANLKKHIPLLKDITDKISSKVKEQYEKSPYPRWINLSLKLKPFFISNLISEHKLKIFNNGIRDIKSPQILVAGCGTGQHSIVTASRFKDSKILAIDLSLSSLAYAKRKTEELNIENIDYMQADILDLGKLCRQFDIVESAGVLHHMDEPFAGWKVLTDCLKPGGLMNIALYSELARQHIVKMRKEISDLGIASSDTDMKSFRKMLMKSNKSHHQLILNSPDLYSMSTLKDLIFHVQEHRFTIAQIKDCLSELGLKFCGFEKSKVVSDFKIRNAGHEDPYNLDKWEAYEEANPRSFAGMYQFWCQKTA